MSVWDNGGPTGKRTEMVSVPPLRLPATGGDGGTLAGLPPPSSTVEGHDSAQAPPTVSSGGPPPALVSGARPAGGAGLANPDPRPHDGVHDSASDSEAGASGVGGEDDASDGAGSSRSDGAVSLLSASTGSTGRAFRKAKERLDQLRQEALERNLRSFQIPPGEEVNVLYPSEAAVVSTFAGTGEAGCRNGRAEDASFNRPQGVAVTPWTPRTIRYGVCGVVYVSDTLNHVIRKIDRKGTVSVFAGDGKPGYVDGNAPIARFYEPCGLAVNSDGDVFVCDRLNNCVRKIEMKTRKVTTFVGNGRAGYGTVTAVQCVARVLTRVLRRFFDGGKVAATFNRPHNVCCDRYNNLFVTDFLNNRVRRVTPDRKVTTVVGDGAFRHAVGRCAASRTAGPMGVAADSWGNVYFTDQVLFAGACARAANGTADAARPRV